MHIEHNRAKNLGFSGAASDIFKCFDQIDRDLLYQVAAAAGIPHRILTAYANFQEHLKVYNSLALGLGTPHMRACGIPQGCPLSMMFTALLLRASMQITTAMGARPRTLADDLLATACGPGHAELIIKVTEATHTFL